MKVETVRSQSLVNLESIQISSYLSDIKRTYKTIGNVELNGPKLFQAFFIKVTLIFSKWLRCR